MVFAVDELRDEYSETELRSDAVTYPPLACRLEVLTGSAFERVRALDAIFPASHSGDLAGGLITDLVSCPQAGCDFALIWVHTDGGLIVVLAEDSHGVAPDGAVQVQIFTSSARLRRHPPEVVTKLIASLNSYWGEHRRLSLTWIEPPPTPAAMERACPQDVIRARAAHYEAARRGSDVTHYTPCSTRGFRVW